jgi:hypothetical protein
MDACCLVRGIYNGYVIAGLSVLLSLTHGDMALQRVACYQGHEQGERLTLMIRLALFVKPDTLCK